MVVLEAWASDPFFEPVRGLFRQNLAWHHSLDGSSVGGKAYADDWGTNILSNVGTTFGTNGLMGQAAAFNGSSRALVGATNLSLHVSNQNFTVSYWLWVNVSNQTFAGTVGRNSDSFPFNKDEWRFDYQNGRTTFSVGNGTGLRPTIVSTNFHYTNEWVLVIGWRDGGAIYLQVNTPRARMTESGHWQTTNVTVNPGCCSNLEIGRSRNSSYLDGRIDDVTMWTNRALSAYERSMIWNAGQGGVSRFVTGTKVKPQ